MQQKDTQKLVKVVILALLTAVMIILSFTPLGYVKLGIIEATLHVIPVALGAIALGPVGGTFMGAVFGITSFMTCLGIGVPSAFGATLLGINPIFTFILCVVPRTLDGLLVGLIHKALKGRIGTRTSCFITGLLSALFNTILFLSTLMLLFSNTEFMQGLINGQNLLLFMCTFAGFGAVMEMVISPIVTGAIGAALYKAKLIK